MYVYLRPWILGVPRARLDRSPNGPRFRRFFGNSGGLYTYSRASTLPPQFPCLYAFGDRAVISARWPVGLSVIIVFVSGRSIYIVEGLLWTE